VPGSSRGALIALAAGGAAAAVVVIVLAVFAVRALRGEAPAPPPAVVGESARAGEEGMRARGTEELRKIGCEQAVVIDIARLMHDASVIREGEPRYIVTCDASIAAPPCDRAAATYFAALGGPAEGLVNVRVAPRGARVPTCSRLYAPNGADRGPYASYR